MKEARELQTLIDQLDRYIKEQDEQIKALHKQVHHLAGEVVSMNRAIGAALAALQTGTALDVAAAIAILRKG